MDILKTSGGYENNLIANKGLNSLSSYNKISTELDNKNDNAQVEAAKNAVADTPAVMVGKVPAVIRTEDGVLHTYNKKTQEYYPIVK